MRGLFTAMLMACLILAGNANAFSPDKRQDEKFQDRIELLTMWKMMDALDLDQATAEKVLQIRRQFLIKKKELRSGLQQSFRSLRELLKDPQAGNDKALADAIASIRAKRKQLQQIQDGQYDEVAKVLTVRQQAQLVLFMRDFYRELHSITRPEPGHQGAPFHMEKGGPGDRKMPPGPGMQPPRPGASDRPGPPPGPPPGGDDPHGHGADIEGAH